MEYCKVCLSWGCKASERRTCRILHTLRVRYALDMIYTYSGGILIAVGLLHTLSVSLHCHVARQLQALMEQSLHYYNCPLDPPRCSGLQTPARLLPVQSRCRMVWRGGCFEGHIFRVIGAMARERGAETEVSAFVLPD